MAQLCWPARDALWHHALPLGVGDKYRHRPCHHLYHNHCYWIHIWVERRIITITCIDESIDPTNQVGRVAPRKVAAENAKGENYSPS